MGQSGLQWDVSDFSLRHLGSGESDQKQMLEFLGLGSLEELLEETIPRDLRMKNPLNLPQPMSESEVLDRANQLGDKNKLFRSFIGMGYYGTHTPPVIQRSILENPGYYTAYTPYQAEISQGRLQALVHFQTMVQDLTGMEIANSSLLDEGTALAEAVLMAWQIKKKKSCRVFVLQPLFPQSLGVLETRCSALGIELELGEALPQNPEDFFAVVLQYPNGMGEVSKVQENLMFLVSSCALTIVSADLMSLCLFKSPGEMGADIVVGSSQRFGLPMGFGGPHAAYLATLEKYKRFIPGRIVGLSKDSRGRPAYRLALQTREQHIRREKATSNICTSQVLLAVMAGMYGVYHGPQGLKGIAQGIFHKTFVLAECLREMGYPLRNSDFFDTLFFEVNPNESRELETLSLEKKMNWNHWVEGFVGLSLDETTRWGDLWDIVEVFARVRQLPLSEFSKKFKREKSQTAPRGESGQDPNGLGFGPELIESLFQETSGSGFQIPQSVLRKTDFMTHPVFNRYHSETELLRYITRLQKKDITLSESMIPLGSCTMKLNATSQVMPITWAKWSQIHPFAPLDQAQGYLILMEELKSHLCEITGFSQVSLQPNAGSQGEYGGLWAIRKYHESRGQRHRNICLIPSSAHGTNPASAVMVGMKVVLVSCDSGGNIDCEDLSKKIDQYQEALAALMMTYPSTHGVFEPQVRWICDRVHQAGGQVYMDGANLNAMLGLCQPGHFGVDVSHLNLHKTFCIPHGGGGPGVGPVAVASHLAPFLPQHNMVSKSGPSQGPLNISAAPWGSALILPISWAFIRLMGSKGLEQCGSLAILNANYIAARLKNYYPILYRGERGRVAHECIVDLRPIKEATGVRVDDVAKRLMDYGFHAPTVSWPVPETLMIEPTESEGLGELDRFCEAMISIRHEIEKIAQGVYKREDSPLAHAPHTVRDLVDTWDRKYSPKEAVYPLAWVEDKKFWVSVNRVDNVYGDKNLFCSCGPVEEQVSTVPYSVNEGLV